MSAKQEKSQMNRTGFSRRKFLGQTAAVAVGGALSLSVRAKATQSSEKSVKSGRGELSVCINRVFRSKPFEDALDKVKNGWVKGIRVLGCTGQRCRCD